MKRLSPNTKVAFSSIVTRKDKKDRSKTVQDTNSQLKNYCSQKNIDFIQNSNIIEEHLGIKKLHLNKKCNSLLANKYMRSTFWDDIDSNCFEVNVDECESKHDIPDRLSDVASERSLKAIRTKNLNGIVLEQLNIYSLRNKFDILTDQISGNVDVIVISERKTRSFHTSFVFRHPKNVISQSPFGILQIVCSSGKGLAHKLFLLRRLPIWLPVSSMLKLRLPQLVFYRTAPFFPWIVGVQSNCFNTLPVLRYLSVHFQWCFPQKRSLFFGEPLMNAWT